MSYKIITISREFGSGGRFIGRQIADKLGISFYDSEIINKVAEKTGLSSKYIEKNGEYAPHRHSIAYSFVSRDSTGASIDDKVYNIQKEIITEIAEKESCVIIGRCADYILRDRTDCLNIFIFGNEDAKVERITKLYGKTESEAKKMMKSMDKKRSVNYNFYTDRKWGDFKNYALSINSSIIGYDNVVNMITDIYKR